ncbi:hypothetical protein BJ322DRAFT_1058444 [Thelephora terrestris]|uniref:Uncharacterized protein n=1 Tax=Thelephora terrestris TaxID=56493 RepID=A0A9P6L7Z8_9AGAM|nr:hypothetical protein BJ322DRAFT_1058444 [Thelephora terrestris]
MGFYFKLQGRRRLLRRHGPPRSLPGFFSYAREYMANQTHLDSIEWTILPYDNDSGAFSTGRVRVDDRLRHWQILRPTYWWVWQDGVVGYHLCHADVLAPTHHQGQVSRCQPLRLGEPFRFV